MPRPIRTSLTSPAIALFLVLALLGTAGAEIRFNRDVRPILSDRCFQCHGPDSAARKADLRLDLREHALEALAPGRPDQSEVIARLVHEDPRERMPPRKTHKRVSPEEVATLETWIAEGAKYDPHWSFIPVRRPTPPAVSNQSRAANEIDRFILERLEAESLAPSPPAGPATLARRVTLDLTGLSPTPREIEDFVDACRSGDQKSALEDLVDRLFASPRYGEHLAYWWLDTARYADSDGYESDPIRNMWPWRDWVIETFNANMPYDRFVTEQLAGDLLENPTLRQKLASGFNRNHRLNNEGGITPEEWIVEYRCDRAETAATAFLGLAWGCARCHDHKFDPITQRDYYRLYAFFDDIEEKGSASGKSAPPTMAVPALEHFEEYREVLAAIAPVQKKLAALGATAEFKSAHDAWLKEIEVADKPDVADKTGAEGEAGAVENIRVKLPGGLGTTAFAKWTAAQKKIARDHHLQLIYAPPELQKEFRPLNKRLVDLRRTGATVMVMLETAEPAPAHILERGSWDQPRDPVTAGTPGFLPSMEKGLPRNRLGLARWITSTDNPLTARVAVNRVWERFFGTGIVKTQEDFGLQGEAPSHPELLDWLAVDFMESGWDLQALQKKIILSNTYRQSSAHRPQLRARDPENRLLARGSRYRLSAPVIRDQALFAAGLLVERPGGPPVKPYQPDGLWREIIKGRAEYTRDTGDKLYRRSLYTLWRRAVNPPLMTLLDANMRDVCDVSQRRTNTPLQALLLMNDITFVEAARGLGARLLREGGDTDAARVDHAMRLVTGRPPAAEEKRILTAELASQRARFAKNPEAAAALVAIGESKADPTLDPVELAAHTSLARVLLNLDETLTKE